MDPTPKLDVVGSLDVLPASAPEHDTMAAAQLAALRRLLVSDEEPSDQDLIG